MKNKFFISTLFLFLSLFSFAFQTYAEKIEDVKATDYVTDYTNTLTKEQNLDISKQLGDLEKATKYQVAVVMLNDIDGDYIEHYAVKLYEKLGLGNADTKQGALFLISKNTREMRIEVGYGLEPILTDGITKNILDNYVRPEFKNGNYYEGIKKGVELVNNTLIDPNTAIPEPEKETNSKDWFSIFFVLFVVGINILGWLFAIIARTKSWWLGGVVTFVFGFAVLYFVFGLNPIGDIILFIFTLGGFIFDYFISKNYKYWQNKMPMNPGDKTTPAWWAGGTWGPGGGNWTNSSGGSGFGGFGGGGFSGGGGSSSSW